MKILMLSRLYLPHIGGVELHIQNLIAHADPADQFTIITEQHDPTLPTYEEQDRVVIHRIPMGSSKKLSIWTWIAWHIPLFLSHDVIHIHDVFFWLLPFLPILLTKRLTMTFHGYEGNEDPTAKQIFWHRLADSFTAGNICIGGFHEKWYGVRPTEISFGAVDERLLQVEKPKGNRGKIRRFVYVGRLSADTGILTYLQGFARLPAEYKKQWILDVYGDGPDREQAKNLVRAQKLPVTFHGFVRPEDIPWTAIETALVSRYLSILEALTVGIPVIAQANSGIKADYLNLSPFARWIQVVRTEEDVVSALVESFQKPRQDTIKARKEAQDWARKQTWEVMYGKYKKIWGS